MTDETTRHPGEDDLVLLFYGEADDPAALEAHLAGCAECRAASGHIRETLASVHAPEGPEHAPDEARLWQRIRPQLAGQIRPAARRPAWPRRFLAPAALAASLVAAFLLGRHLPRPAAQGTSGPVRERILLVAVGDHLERSQVVLLELLNADPKVPLDVTSERRSAEDLVASNRLYRQAALRSGDPGVARVLEELERVLVEVASGPSELRPDDLAALRQRIEGQGVLFRVQVVESQIRRREKGAAMRPPKIEL